jgi:hypothetical protein
VIWGAISVFSKEETMFSTAEGAGKAPPSDDGEDWEALAAQGDDGAGGPDWSDPSSWAAAVRELSFGTPARLEMCLQDALGAPSAEGLPAMALEHTLAPDADVVFTAPNYGIKSTSRIEWFIVVEPDRALDELGLDDWLAGGGHTPVSLGFRHVHAPHSAHFRTKIDAVNAQLRQAGDSAPLTPEHFCALRMYTGPMYCK